LILGTVVEDCSQCFLGLIKKGTQSRNPVPLYFNAKRS